MECRPVASVQQAWAGTVVEEAGGERRASIPEGVMGHDAVSPWFPVQPKASGWCMACPFILLSRRRKNISRMIKIASIHILIWGFSPPNRKRNTRTKTWHSWKEMSTSTVINGAIYGPLLRMDRIRRCSVRNWRRDFSHCPPTWLPCLFILRNETLYPIHFPPPPSAHESFTYRDQIWGQSQVSINLKALKSSWTRSLATAELNRNQYQKIPETPKIPGTQTTHFWRTHESKKSCQGEYEINGLWNTRARKGNRCSYLKYKY